MINGQRLSITTGSLNRLEPLKQSLATWLAHPEPDEIILVDWGNEIPLLESLHDFTDPRIIIARAEGQKFWHNSKCHNLELQLATGEQLLRLDNDCLLDRTFFEKHVLENNCFFAGDWQGIPAEMDDKRNLTGTLYVHASDVRAVNGYNERLLHYGYEDDDLYHRLVAEGLKRNNIDLSTVEHIPHSDTQRYENLEIANQLPHPTAPKQIREKIAFNVKRNLTQMSRTITMNFPWTTRDHMTEWRIRKVSSNYYMCEEIPGDKTYKPPMYIDMTSLAYQDFHSTKTTKKSNKKLPTFSSDWACQIRTIWPDHVFPLLNRHKPLNWLELGSFEGRSALWTIENLFLNPDSKITCIDTWQARNKYLYEATFDSNTSNIPQIIKRKGTTSEVLPTLPPNSFHGCYIDASHEEEDVLTDARLVLPLMLPNAVIVFDDYGWDEGPGVRRAIRRLLDEEWTHRVQFKYLGYQAVFQVNPQP